MVKKEAIQRLLGLHILRLRVERNFTQKELALRVNKDQQSIHRLEAGKINPSYYYLFEISRGLNISLKDLCDLGI